MAPHSIIGAGVVVALFVGGCNGDGEGEGPTRTTTTTVAPTTTTAPTTTLDPLAAEEAAVSEAAEQARLARSNAFMNLDDPAAVVALEQYYVLDGSALAEVQLGIQDLAESGWSVRQNPTVPETLTVEQITFDNVSAPTTAELVVCIVDSAVIYEPGAAPDGTEAIVDDSVVARRSVYEMVKDGEVWKLRDVVRGESWDGLAECPAG
jgi:hypothetical protein